MKLSRVGIVGAIAAAPLAFGAAVAGAEPAGYWQEQAEQLPSATSAVEFPSFPIQLAEAGVAVTESGIHIAATPYLAPWAHDLVPIDRNAAVDLRGSIHLSAPGGRVDIAGHCIFAGEGTRDGETHPLVSPVVTVGDDLNGLLITPTVHGR